ncbi:MAG TPA: hypothetical protein PLU24_05895, partial [Candidatus Omnitrophota bacterium]|nr:hypothetical protein [Candidatus Omnitrophota bacterium]
IITSAVKKLGNTHDFVGHIGGDDFVYLTTPDKEELIAQECINEFDRLMPLHYSCEDRKNGFVRTKDRSGHFAHIPLMDLSIAIVNNRTTGINSIFQLIEIAFEIKKFLKKRPSSNYLVNRRIADAGLDNRPNTQDEYAHELKKHHHHLKDYKPLGQILLETHILNEEQLNEALEQHWNSGQRLGEAVISMGITDEEHINRLLEHQPAFTEKTTK